MRILDKYILKRYLTTFLFTLLILIPVAVAIDISEKVDKFSRHYELTVSEIINDYYIHFIFYYTNTFMPLALFISVIIFTSILANNTEIVAMNSAKISLKRLLFPYFIGATFVTILALVMNHYVVPLSNGIRNKFEDKYLKRIYYRDESVRDFSLQLNDSTYLFVQNFNLKTKSGYNLSIEKYDGLKLKSRLISNSLSWKEKDSLFSLYNWKERIIFDEKDSIFSGVRKEGNFGFTPKDFNYKNAQSQEMPSDELMKFIEISKNRGVKNLNSYLVELHKRTSLPIASYILTLIAVVLAQRKRRGGMGVNLAIGVTIMFLYIFFLKVAEVLGAVAGVNSFIYVWMPNIVFGCFAVFLYFKMNK